MHLNLQGINKKEENLDHIFSKLITIVKFVREI